jgi:hypothetical protein
MIGEIRQEVERRGITRLCHFTPSRKLAHIAAGETGVLSTQALCAQERDMFDATDLQRLDGHPSHVCCSIEYPNAWYFQRARQNDQLFRDWVVLLIRPRYLWQEGALFCPRNAAAEYGGLLRPGMAGFERLFASTSGAPRCPPRGTRHLACCPTDDQAEVLIPDRIRFGDIIGIAVSSMDQANLEAERLNQLSIDPSQFRFVAAETLYNPRQLATCIRAGRRPPETEWNATR